MLPKYFSFQLFRNLAQLSFFQYNPPMPSREKLPEFVAWCGRHIMGD